MRQAVGLTSDTRNMLKDMGIGYTDAELSLFLYKDLPASLQCKQPPITSEQAHTINALLKERQQQLLKESCIIHL
jgi:hypothetical protein